MTNNEIKILLDRYKAGTATEEEVTLLLSLVQNWGVHHEVNISEEEYARVQAELSFNLMPLPNRNVRARKLSVWSRMAGIAAAVAALVIGIWFFSAPRHINIVQDLVGTKNANDIAPGKNTAIMTLANGKTIMLSDVKTGVIINEDKITYNDGSTVEEGDSDRGSNGNSIQTIATPKGGTYQVVLPDGSKVQLNAASSIKFTSNFKSMPERRIELSGEAYFEVFKNKNRPFVVASKNQEIKVLGTHFNVSAYSDDQISKTTLLEGAVRVTLSSPQIVKQGTKYVNLLPGQQAVQVDGSINVENVNANDAVDWKNGEFICKNEALVSIMKKIARWYDVDVVYTNPELKNKTFSGSLSRYDHVTDVLKALEFAGTMKFKLENRKISVL